MAYPLTYICNLLILFILIKWSAMSHWYSWFAPVIDLLHDLWHALLIWRFLINWIVHAICFYVTRYLLWRFASFLINSQALIIWPDMALFVHFTCFINSRSSSILVCLVILSWFAVFISKFKKSVLNNKKQCSSMYICNYLQNSCLVSWFRNYHFGSMHWCFCLCNYNRQLPNKGEVSCVISNREKISKTYVCNYSLSC